MSSALPASPLSSSPASSPPHSPSWASTGQGPQGWAKTVLPKTISTLASTLSSNSDGWKSRLHALQEVEAMVLDCREFERGASNTTATTFRNTLATLIATLATPLTVQITDLRSEIVRQASHTISFLATQLPDSILTTGDTPTITAGPFHKCGVKLLPAVLTVASSSNSVMRGYAMTAAQDVVGHVYSGGAAAPGGGILGHLFTELKQTKNKALRAICMELLSEVVMKRWPKRLWCGGSEFNTTNGKGSTNGGANANVAGISYMLLEDHLLFALSSADNVTRGAAYRAVWHYAKFGSLQRAQSFFRNLESRTKKGILDSRKVDDDVDAFIDGDIVGSTSDDSSLPSSSSLRSVGASRKTLGPSNGPTHSRVTNGSATQIDFSATSISDSILTKALADARKKSGVSTSATRISQPPATSAAATKKLSALGLPSRVPTKLKPAVPTISPAASAGGKLGAPSRPISATAATTPTNNSIQPPPADPQEDKPTSSTPSSPPSESDAALRAELLASLDADAHASNARPELRHQRSISSVQLDLEPGLLNEIELGTTSSADMSETNKINDNIVTNTSDEQQHQQQPADGVPSSIVSSASNSVPTSAHHSASPSRADLSPLRVSHLKNLSISSTASEIVPRSVTSSSLRDGSGGSRTPRGTSSGSAGKSAKTTATGFGSSSSRTTSSTFAARQLLPKSNVTTTTSTTTTTRRSLPPTSTSTTTTVSPSRTAQTTAARRSLGITRPTSAATPSDNTTPTKRTPTSVGFGSGVRRPASASASASPSGPTTPSSATSPQPRSRLASPNSSIAAESISHIPRPGTASPAKSPVVKSPSRFANPANINPNTTTSRLTLKFPTDPSRHASQNPTPTSMTPMSQSLSSIGSPIGSSLHSPAGDALILPSSGLPSPLSSLPTTPISSEFSTLLQHHRQHITEAANHLQQLNALYTSTSNGTPFVTVGTGSSVTNATAATATVTPYVDSMIKLLSDNLAKTTKLLEGFMNVRRKEIAAAQKQQQQQQQQHVQVQAQVHATSQPPIVVVPPPAASPAGPLAAPAPVAAPPSSSSEPAVVDSTVVPPASTPTVSAPAPVPQTAALVEPTVSAPTADDADPHTDQPKPEAPIEDEDNKDIAPDQTSTVSDEPTETTNVEESSTIEPNTEAEENNQ